MDRFLATERGCPADFWRRKEPWLLPRSECKAAFWLTRGEALVFVLLLSFGLWAAIWGAVALLGAGGRW
jgi:hypothetical protein